MFLIKLYFIVGFVVFLGGDFGVFLFCDIDVRFLRLVWKEKDS